MTGFCVALGGNVGPVREQLAGALDMLREVGIEILAVSGLYQTAGVGTRNSNAFLNAAAIGETTRNPEALLDQLQAVEHGAGRFRESHWGPRTLDLDLILYDDQTWSSPRLALPHPHAWFRRFVLDPLCDVAGDWVHPVKKLAVAELRARLLQRPVTVALAGGTREDSETLLASCRRNHPDVAFSAWDVNAGPRTELPTFIVWLGTTSEHSATWNSLPLVPRVDPSIGRMSQEEFVTYLLSAARQTPERIAHAADWWPNR